MTSLYMGGQRVGNCHNSLLARDIARDLSLCGESVTLFDHRGQSLGSYHRGIYRVPQAPLPIETLVADAMAEAIEYTQGDKGRAAELLGIGRTTWYTKEKALGAGA
jgi:transcriptional regulator of acetoin/glycerol metabolism